MRSSYSSKVESSCSEPAKCRDERTGDAGVEHEGSGSIEGVARGEAGTFNAARGGRATRVHRSLGKTAAGAGEEGRRPGRGAWAARAGVEPAPGGEGSPQRAEGEPGDAAPVADRGRAAAGEGAEGGGGARVAAAPELPRRVGAVGHLGARLAGRAGAEAVPGGDDR